MATLIVTTWEDRCGIAEYAANLVKSTPELNWLVANLGSGFAECIRLIRMHDNVVINYEPGLFQGFDFTCLAGKNSVLILHTSGMDGNRNNGITHLFKKVIVHEINNDGFDVVPMGVPVSAATTATMVFPYSVGTAGFPFPWKGFDTVAIAANIAGMFPRIIAPESRHFDTAAMEISIRNRLLSQFGSSYRLEWIREFHAQEKVVQLLSQHDVNAFLYQGGNSGISAASRLGIAAKRPLVLSYCRQFNDLHKYKDEIYFTDGNITQVAALFEQAAKENRIPSRAYKETNWMSISEQYISIIRR